MQALDGNGNAIIAAEATAKPLLPPVTGLDIAPAEQTGHTSGTVLKATWNAVSGSGYYDVQWKAVGSDWPDWQERPTATSHTITGLTAGTTYAVRVRAAHAITGAGSVWTTGYAVPNTLAPTDLTASGATSGQVSLAWDAPTAGGKTVKHYGIESWSGSFEAPDDVGDRITTPGETSSRSATVTALRPGTEYTFRMYAEFTDGTRSGMSNTVTATTAAAAGSPNQPVSVTATVMGWDAIKVSWVSAGGKRRHRL